MVSKLIRLMIASVFGLTMAIALTFIVATDIASGEPLHESHGNGQVISPTQTMDGTWGPGTITATTDVLISPTVVITIAANTTIRVADGKGLTVLGDLHSDGPVTFTTASLPAVPGVWNGITYTTGSRGYLNHAIIEYAQHALVLSTTNPITLSNSTIRYNEHAPASGVDAFGAGIAIVGGTHLVTNTQVYENILIGSGAGGDALGGGIDIQGAGSQVINSIIYSNVITSTNAFAIGGGIAIRGNGNASLIEGCQVLSNTVYAGGLDTSTTYGEGGGIGIPADSATRAVIRHNWIAGNVNRSVTANGGGIGLSLDATADLIDSNIIYNNLCESPGGNDNYWAEGGGIDTWGSTNQVTVTNNLILSNTVRCIGICYSNTGPVGGGMMVNGASAANPTRVVNNTVVGNHAEGQISGGYGGAFGAQTNGVFANNIVADNTCTASGCGGAFYWWAGVSVDYGDLWNNSPNDYAGNITTLRPADISQNPLFLGTGDLVQWYHLRQGSPAIDGGTNTNAPNDDYDHQSRPLGATWDIGFDEVQPFTYAKSVDLSTARGNDPLVYTIVVANPDPHATFEGGVITDTLPLNIRHSSGPNCDIGVCGYDSGANAITWTGNISASSALNLSFTAQVNTGLADGTNVTNTTSITVGAIGKTTNMVTTTIFNPAFTLTKQAMGTLVAGAPLTYMIGITNTSIQAGGTGVVVNDALPSNANHISGGALQGGIISWTIPSISANSSAQVSFVVSTCQTSLTNATYQVITSAQGIASSTGTPLATFLTPPTVVADFTPISVTTGSTAYFTSTSTTNGSLINAWTWAFGDSQVGSGATTSHIYANMGTYTVTLTVTDTCGYTNTKTSSITVKANTVTTVTSSLNPSAPGQSVTFTATVSVVLPDAGTPTGSVSLYDSGTLLGNGTLNGSNYVTLTTSSLVVGGHVIAAAYTGDSDYDGSTSAVLNQVVTDTPITGLNAVNDSPTTLGQATTFTATATGSNISYAWDFGDGHTANNSTASNTYAAVGFYTARVTATNGVSQVVMTTPVTITDTPITGLSAVNDSPTMLDQATFFTVTTTGSNISYAWDFGDGHTANNSTASNTYAAVGLYTAHVTATNGVSQVVATTPVTITFVPVTHTLVVNTTGDGSGTVSPSVGAHIYDHGTVVTLTAAQSVGSSFAGWSGACTNAFGDCVVTLDANKAVTATFRLNAINHPPIANAGPDQTVYVNSTIMLNSSASSDPDGDLPLTYGWTQMGGPSVAFNNVLSVTTFSAPSTPTVLTFTLTVTDTKGLASPQDTVIITTKDYYIYLPVVMRNFP